MNLNLRPCSNWPICMRTVVSYLCILPLWIGIVVVLENHIFESVWGSVLYSFTCFVASFILAGLLMWTDILGKVAILCIKPFAKRNFPNLQFILAELYLGYPHDSAETRHEALKWYREAANRGHARAQYMLGRIYQAGEGVEKDPVQAVELFRKAAAQGYSAALFHLGLCFQKGEGIARDPKRAVELYRTAANQGDVLAQYHLGLCYQYGQGVERDTAEAVKWYSKIKQQQDLFEYFSQLNFYELIAVLNVQREKISTFELPFCVKKIEYGSFSRKETHGGPSFYFSCIVETNDVPSAITTISIPTTVKNISEYAFIEVDTSMQHGSINIDFDGLTNLKSIVVPDANKKYCAIDGVLFTKDRCALLLYPPRKEGKSYKIPDSVKHIGDGAFAGCSDLTSVTIPDSVKHIGDKAFAGCSGLTSVTIPDSVKHIGSFAFGCCSSLTSITIPDSVKRIGSLAFEGCSGLTSVTIPDSLKT